MATRKRNEWLEADGSGDEDQSSDIERPEESRGATIAGRIAKRRKVETDDQSVSEEDSLEEDHRNGEELDDYVARKEEEASQNVPESKGTQIQQETLTTEPKPANSEQKAKSSLAKQVAKASEKAHKSGVIYISRIPPFMKPQAVKHLLTPYAPSGLGRVFLTPETPDARNSRIRSGGNRKRNFTDGWVEFVSKREAKIAVETLNTRTMGGKKRAYYHDDVWNLKYLKGFKWRHLTEQIANENAERAARMRAEDARERKEQREYLKNVEKAKMLEGMEKKRGKKETEADEVGGDQSGAASEERAAKPSKRQFKQFQVKTKPENHGKEEKPTEEVRRVLSKIF